MTVHFLCENVILFNTLRPFIPIIRPFVPKVLKDMTLGDNYYFKQEKSATDYQLHFSKVRVIIREER